MRVFRGGIFKVGVYHGLTDIQVRTAKPKEKDYKLSDSDGLFLLVASPGVSAGGLNIDSAARKSSLLLGHTPIFVTGGPEQA